MSAVGCKHHVMYLSHMVVVLFLREGGCAFFL